MAIIFVSQLSVIKTTFRLVIPGLSLQQRMSRLPTTLLRRKVSGIIIIIVIMIIIIMIIIIVIIIIIIIIITLITIPVIRHHPIEHLHPDQGPKFPVHLPQLWEAERLHCRGQVISCLPPVTQKYKSNKKSANKCLTLFGFG